MMKPVVVALTAAFALGAPLHAGAQESRDQRAKQPESRDHRAKKKRKPRTADQGPAVRDHRKRKPTVKDRGAKGPVIRDHRGKGKGKGALGVSGLKLKSGLKLDIKAKVKPADTRGPRVRDHRKHKLDRTERRAEYRVRAVARWNKRRAQLAKKEAERQANYKQRREERIASRAERRRKHRAEIRATWRAEMIADARVQTELQLHGRRVAWINRLRRLAEIKDRGKLVIRIEIVAQREDDRHAERMGLLGAELNAQ